MTGKEFLERLTAEVESQGLDSVEIDYDAVLDCLASIGFAEATKEYYKRLRKNKGEDE